MKWLFLLLFVVNVGAFSWYKFGAPPYIPNEDPVYEPPVSRTIYTLSEVPKGAVGVTQVEQEPDSTVTDALEAELLALTEKEDLSLSQTKESLLCPKLSFEKDQERKSVLAEINAKNWSVKDYQSNGERKKYWVYIDAPSKREDAIQIVDTLKKKGVDSFIINRGEMKDRISLGLYSTSDTAEAEKNRIAKLSKLDVKVFEHMRKVPLYVIEFEQGINSSDWKSFVSGLKLDKMMIKLEKNPC